eukprot:Em0009g393a
MVTCAAMSLPTLSGQSPNASCFGSGIDAADDEDDVMLKQMTLIAAVVLMEVILVPDFKNAPDPEDISVLRCGNWFYMRNFPHFLKVLMLHVLNLICFGSAADEEDDVMLKQMTLIAAVVLWRLF